MLSVIIGIAEYKYLSITFIPKQDGQWPLKYSTCSLQRAIFIALYVWIYITPLPRAGCDMRSIFKLNTANLNYNVPFTWTKAKEPILLYYLPTAKSGNERLINDFHKGIHMKSNTNSLMQDWTQVVYSVSCN